MKAVNLLPGEQRGSTKTSPAASTPTSGGSAFGAYVVLGVLAFAVAASALYVLATNTIKDRKAELARVTAEAEATKRQAGALQSYADFKTLADQRISTVNSLATARFDWERTLGDLSRALPSDVHLTSVTGTTGTQTSGGASAVRGAIQAPALELSGCTRTQSQVATLMSRMRNVRGVTRVTLTKSDKDGGVGTTVSAASAGSGTAGTPAQLCPKGAPPAFNVIIFFERSVLSAGATPNVAASAGATTQPGASSAAATPAGSAPATGNPTTAPATGATTTTPATGTSATQGVSAK